MSYALEFEAEPFLSLGGLAGSLGRAAAGVGARVADALREVDGSRIIDLTAKADKSNRKGTRDPKSVYALVLHQMACCANRRDPLNSYLKIGSHFAILRDGRILQLHPVSALVWASNGFNNRSVAVEFAGNFPDTRGRWWKGDTYGKDQVTPAQIEAGRYLILWLRKSMGLTHVLAHRQSSGTRENDPGPDIWFNVGQWAIDTLELRDGGAGFKIGTGNAIPDEWRRWNRPVAATSPAARPVQKEWTDEIAHEQWEEPSAQIDELDASELELMMEHEQEWEEERRRVRSAGPARFAARPRFSRAARPRPAPPPRPPRFPGPNRPRFPRRPAPQVFMQGSTGAAAIAGSCNCPDVCAEHGTEQGRWLQSALNQVQGLRLPVNGVIDATTRSAIRSFQEQRGLPVDGIAGPEVERALIEARASGGAPSEGAGAGGAAGPQAGAASTAELFELEDFEWEEEVNRGSREYITWVQRALNQFANANLVEDGISGALTRAAVKAFQRSNGLGADGIVGPITEAALIRAGAAAPPGSQAGLPMPAPVPVPYPTVPGTGNVLRDRIVQIALQERKRWNDGKLKEWDDAARNILIDYWHTGVGMTPTDAAHFTDELYAWSAAFICWVLRKAGAGNNFAYSSYHSTYVAAAYKNQRQGSANPFKAYSTRQSAPRLGDLLCTTYSSNGVRPPAEISQVRANTGGYHCDIVVASAPGKLTVIGGNLGDSVGLKTVRIDSQGYVTDGTYFAVLRAG